MASAKTDVVLIVRLYVTDVGIKAVTRHDFKYVVKGRDRAFAMNNTWRENEHGGLQTGSSNSSCYK